MASNITSKAGAWPLLLLLAGMSALPAQDPPAGASVPVPVPVPDSAPATSPPAAAPAPASLEDTRLQMGKWIETQQIISRERKEWQQGREILLGRLELVRQEATTLEERIRQAESGVAEAGRKRDELAAENERFKAAGAKLSAAVAGLESEVRRLVRRLPEPVKEKVQPLFQRIPEDAAATKGSIAERFQNILGILNEVNKANSEITVSHEVRDLSGKPSEVRVIYAGLAQAWYVSGGGHAGIGRPGPDGWAWESSPAIAGEVLRALEILQGKHTPAFVPLPVKIQ